MRSLLQVPAPSPTVLSFLKSQSESISFFSTNPRPGFIFDHAAPRASQFRNSVGSDLRQSATRSISTTVPRRATVEAGFLNLDFLFPRSATSFNPESKLFHTPGRYKTRKSRCYTASRYNSTSGRKWYQRIWGKRAVKGGKPLHPDDLPSPSSRREEGSDTSMFSLGRHISAKAAAQPKLRCTELDENGNIVLTSGEFKKSELIQKVRLQLSDSRCPL